MKKIIRLLSLFSAAAAASWAACPAGVTASQLIQSSTWAFQLSASDFTGAGSATVGTFQALPNGTLNVTQTYSINTTVSRLQQSSGTWTVYPDCSGGLLMIAANGFSMQIEFVYTNGAQGMLLVTVDLNARFSNPGRCSIPSSTAGLVDECCPYECCPYGCEDFAPTTAAKAAGPKIALAAQGPSTTTLTGFARRTTSGCPVGLGDPLDILKGTAWAFQTYSPYYAGGPGSSSAGSFIPFNINGLGRLSGSETISWGAQGPITRQAQISGRYIIYPNCSGGEIMIMNRGFPVQSIQLEFVFADNFKTMLFLNDSNSDDPLSVVIGQAKQQ